MEAVDIICAGLGEGAYAVCAWAGEGAEGMAGGLTGRTSVTDVLAEREGQGRQLCMAASLNYMGDSPTLNLVA